MADNTLPFEYQSQIEAANRRKLLAEALQKQALGFSGAQGGGRIAAKTSPLTWIANAAAGYLSSEGIGKQTQAANAVQQQAEKDRQEEMLGLIRAPEGEQQALGIQGKFGETRALANELAKQKREKLNKIMEMVGKDDPSAGYKIGVSGQLPSEYTPTPTKPTEFGTSPTGTGYGQTFDRKGQPTLKFEPKGLTVNTGTTQETAAAKAVGGKIPEVFEGITGAAKTAINSMESADRIDALLKNPATITGFGAGTLQGLAGLGAALGFQGPDAAAKTQALLAEQAAQTLSNVKKLPGAITEKERPFLELASAGKLDFTPEAIQRLADISRMVGHNTLMQLQSEYAGASKSPGATETGAPGIWPFPKGWNFSADPKKYMETGTGTNRYRYIGDSGVTPSSATKKPLKLNELSPAQKAELLQMLQMLQGGK